MVCVFHGLHGRAAQLIIGLLDSDRLADAVGICDQPFRDVWHVYDLTEREKVAGYEVIRHVQEEGRRPPVPARWWVRLFNIAHVVFFLNSM